MKTFGNVALIIATVLMIAFFLAGCEGDDGKDGAAGIMGPSPICVAGAKDNPKGCYYEADLKGDAGKDGNLDEIVRAKFSKLLADASETLKDANTVCDATAETKDACRVTAKKAYDLAVVKANAYLASSIG